jgi:hypothetical protein
VANSFEINILAGALAIAATLASSTFASAAHLQG